MGGDSIRQWVTAQDGLDELQLTTAEKPEPKEGEVLVKIHTVSLNYRDTEVVMGIPGRSAKLSDRRRSLLPPYRCCNGLDESEDRTHTNVLALKRNVTLKGILNGPKDRFEEMTKFYEKHQIRPVVDKLFGFEEAKEGLKYLFSAGHFGKVVVQVS